MLDLGYADLGCDIKNELLRVYTLLGTDRTPLKRWLAACLWKNLSGAGNPRGLDDPRGLVIQEAINQRAAAQGISTRSWLSQEVV